jgi:HAD superfamily hydrolase (TIGR01509 family)
MVKAVIFDLNGTVLADEYVYGGAFRKVLAHLGRKVDKTYPHIGGIGVEENWPRLISKYHIRTSRPYDELARMTQDAYLKDLPKVRVRSGFIKFVRDIRKKGIKTALATSNTWWIVDKVFERLNLEDFFDCVTTKEEVSFNKPSPDIFLVTADKLGIVPSECVVVEDSLAGIEAASAAGMKVVALAKDRSEKKSYEKVADLVINGFAEITLSKLNLL